MARYVKCSVQCTPGTKWKYHEDWRFCPKCGAPLTETKAPPVKKRPEVIVKEFEMRYGMDTANSNIESLVRIGESYEDWCKRVYGKVIAQGRYVSEWYRSGGTAANGYYAKNLCWSEDPRVLDTVLYQRIKR